MTHDHQSSRTRRAPIVGLVASLCVHALLLVLAAFVLLDRPSGAGQAGDEFELAIVTQSELTDLQLAAQPSAPQIDASSPAAVLDAAVFETPVADPSSAASANLSTGLEGAGSGSPDALDLGGAGAGSASFFGVEARGTRFAYIVDISGSMAGAKILTLRRELTNTIESMGENSSFSVVLYSHQPRIVGGRRKWLRANRRSKDLALREVNSIEAGGATNPLPAFEIVFNLRPRPDAIYFMTDGQFSQVVVQEVARMNSSSIEPTPIHTISFVSKESEAQLKRIAKESGGTYTHIERAFR